MVKLLSGRSLRLDCTVVTSKEETEGDVPTSSILGGSWSAFICRLIRRQNLGQQLGMYAVKSLLERKWRWAFLSAFFVLSPGYIP